MKKEFKSVFAITRMIILEVDYYTCGNNKNPYFTTSCSLFTKSKRDYSICGQCQHDVLPKNSLAMKFFRKWDEKHLQNLTDSEYTELMIDVEDLKYKYKNIYRENYKYDISFYEIKELSMTV